MSNVKWVNTRIDKDLKKRYDEALKLAAKEIGRNIFSPEIIVPAVRAFCDAAESGKAEDFLKGKYTRSK
jgi:hypothetical protein